MESNRNDFTHQEDGNPFVENDGKRQKLLPISSIPISYDDSSSNGSSPQRRLSASPKRRFSTGDCPAELFYSTATPVATNNEAMMVDNTFDQENHNAKDNRSEQDSYAANEGDINTEFLETRHGEEITENKHKENSPGLQNSENLEQILKRMMDHQLTTMMTEITQNLKPSLETHIRELVNEKCNEILETLSERMTIMSRSIRSEISSEQGTSASHWNPGPSEEARSFADVTKSTPRPIAILTQESLGGLTHSQREARAQLYETKERAPDLRPIIRPVRQQSAEEIQFAHKPFFRQFSEEEKKFDIAVIYALNIRRQPIKEIRNALNTLGVNPKFIHNISFIGALTEFIVPIPYAAILANILNKNSLSVHQTYKMDGPQCSLAQLDFNRRRLQEIQQRNSRPQVGGFIKNYLEVLMPRLIEMGWTPEYQSENFRNNKTGTDGNVYHNQTNMKEQEITEQRGETTGNQRKKVTFQDSMDEDIPENSQEYLTNQTSDSHNTQW
jgi:hypothetical protein